MSEPDLRKLFEEAREQDPRVNNFAHYVAGWNKVNKATKQQRRTTHAERRKSTKPKQ